MSDEGTPGTPSDDPSESSLIVSVLKKSGLIEKLMTWLAVAAVGGGASMATHRVSDANEVAAVGEAKAEAQRIAAEFADFKAKYYARQKENRDRADAEHLGIEREQRDAERYLERRLTRLETKLGLNAPPSLRDAVVRDLEDMRVPTR